MESGRTLGNVLIGSLSLHLDHPSSFRQLHTVFTSSVLSALVFLFWFWLGLLLTIARTHPLLPFFNIYMALRDENRCLASEASAYSHYRRGQRERRQRIPKVGDLVLVRNHAVDGQRGRKLESRWLGPRLLVSLSSSGLTGRVRELFGEGGTKKYHLNDLILYVERKDFEVSGVKVFQQGMGTTPAVIGGHGEGEPGARALILRSR